MSSEKPYKYKLITESDHTTKEWQVFRRKDNGLIGTIKSVRAADYMVCRPKRDEGYHSCFANRREAANWLSEHQRDRARFEAEIGVDGQDEQA